eukprot:3565924-Rhodomonas_salina.1
MSCDPDEVCVRGVAAGGGLDVLPQRRQRPRPPGAPPPPPFLCRDARPAADTDPRRNAQVPTEAPEPLAAKSSPIKRMFASSLAAAGDPSPKSRRASSDAPVSEA